VCRPATKSSRKWKLAQAEAMAAAIAMAARVRGALNRGGSAGDDDGMTVKMRSWYSGPRPARVRRGAGWTGGPQRAPRRVRRERQRRVAREKFKAPRGEGAWGRRAAWAACGRTRRRGATALWPDNVSMCSCLNTNISKNFTRSAQSFEYESCRAHLGE
jgi:hypothetical protein